MLKKWFSCRGWPGLLRFWVGSSFFSVWVQLVYVCFECARPCIALVFAVCGQWAPSVFVAIICMCPCVRVDLVPSLWWRHYIRKHTHVYVHRNLICIPRHVGSTLVECCLAPWLLRVAHAIPLCIPVSLFPLWRLTARAKKSGSRQVRSITLKYASRTHGSLSYTFSYTIWHPQHVSPVCTIFFFCTASVLFTNSAHYSFVLYSFCSSHYTI